MKNLTSFCEKKSINIEIVDFENGVFKIENIGNFLFLEKEKLLDDEFQLSLSKKDVELTKKFSIEFYCYSFGGVFYYTSINKIEFLVFDFVGKSKIDDSIFCNLGVHAEYESLNAVGTYDLWINKANFLNHKSIGICEKNTLAGVLPFQLECEKKKLKSVIGETVTVVINKDAHEFKIYCKDDTGWKNCLKINSYINVDNYENKNIPFLEFIKYSKGLFSIIPNSIMSLDIKEIHTIIKTLRSKFEYIYFQIDSVIFDDEKVQLRYFNNIKKYLNDFSDIIEPILINDSYYLNNEDWECKKYLNEIGKFKFQSSKNQHFKTSNEILSIFKPYFTDKKFKIGFDLKSIIELSIKNSTKLANLCDFKIQTGKHKLPKYRNTFNITNEELFDKLIEEGLYKKVPAEKIEEYRKRWETESAVIKMAGFIDYFLILWDIIFWAKNNDILVGVGRGSVGGCLIAYLLDIITIDPIEHDLLFERFLNESRVMGDKYFKIELENGEILKIKEGTQIKMKNGEYKLVENLIQSDDIDIDLVIK